jgi:hypothetical protein
VLDRPDEFRPAGVRTVPHRMFGWTAQRGNEEAGGYVTYLKDGEMVAGMARNEPGSGYPDVWTTTPAKAGEWPPQQP